MQNWSPSKGEIQVTNINGNFAANSFIYGATSNAYFYITNFNEIGTTPKNENFDNLYIEESASKYVNKDEINPFGTI